jgi:hypothetical protein
MQRVTASSFCYSVNRRLVLVGLVIGAQADGHGVTLRDLSTKSGEALVGLGMARNRRRPQSATLRDPQP